MIGADNFGDIGEAVPFQVGRQVAVDGVDQPRPFEYQRRIELHQRRARADLGVGVGPRGDAADADQRQPAFGEFVEIGQHLRRRIEQGFAAEAPGLVPLAIGSPMYRPLCFAIMFGLVSSTILSLFIIPALYTLLTRKSRAQAEALD